MSELPNGWAKVACGELGRWGSGGTPKRTDSRFFSNGTIPWLVIGDLNDGIVTNAQTHITEEGLLNSSAKLLPLNTLLIAMYGSIGKLGVTGIECATNQAIAFCMPEQAIIELRYLFYALKHSRDKLTAQGQGVAQKNISQTILKAHQIPVAPRKEQKLIADKLDSLLTRVDACRDRLDRVPRILKRFRQSVLVAATSGELTKDWREEEVGEDSRPVNWRIKTFGELVESSLYGPRFSAKDYSADGIPTIRTTDMDFDGTIVLRDTPRVSASLQDIEKWGLLDGDLLITRTGSTIGKCAVYEKSLGSAIPSAYLIRFRLNQHDVIPKFVLMFLLSPKGQSLLINGSTSVAQPNGNLD